MIVWWKFGKEDAGSQEDLRIFPPEVVAAQIEKRLAYYRAFPESDWRWWQVSDTLLVERPVANGRTYTEDTRIYYLIPRGLVVVERAHFPAPYERFTWCIHLSKTYFDWERRYWLMKDLFCDILIDERNDSTEVLDLNELAQALDIGLIDIPQASEILHRTDVTLRAIRRGDFPFPEIQQARSACYELGW